VITLALLARLGYGLSHLRRIGHGSEFIPDVAFRELAHDAWLKSGAFRKPRIAVSNEVTSPVTFSAGDTWILLPRSWRDWDDIKLRAVLTHELAHIQRRDSQTLLLASLATCLFWFHPLSWFLRRKLSALAEESCDEVVILKVATPEQYANFLIDFAGDVKRSRGRLVAGAIAVTGSSSLRRRIERLFADTNHMQKGRRLFAALALSLFLPALYLTAAARSDQLQVQENSQQSKPIWPQWDKVRSMSPLDAMKIESSLRTNPDDLDMRMELLVYYSMNGQETPFAGQLLWFINQHPDIETLAMAESMFHSNEPLNDNLQGQLSSAWERAIAAHLNSPEVLDNAALFLERANPDRGLDLLQQADALSPAKHSMYEREIAALYAAAELRSLRSNSHLNGIQMSTETETRLRDQLAESRDPDLLAETGRLVVQLSRAQERDQQFNRGLTLIQQAIKLDPDNPKWREALQSAEAEPQRQLNYQRLVKPVSPPLDTIRVGSKVAEANLISKSEPVYPPLALQAHIQGTVEFTVTVGTDGKVQEVQLVRGHPLMVNAAKEAVLKWVYQPVLADGKAVPFITNVVVPFNLPQ
jgi:TonB family protein